MRPFRVRPQPLLVALALVAGVSLVSVSLVVGHGGPWWHAGGPGIVWIGALVLGGGALGAAPLRRAVDVRVARSRAMAEGLRELEAFQSALRAGRAEPEGIEEVLRTVLEAPSLGLALVLPDGGGRVTMDGLPAQEPARGDEAFMIRQAAETLAEITYPAGAIPHPDLLGPITRAATLAVEIARLRVELRRRLADVQASRARIVAAGDQERRRVERNLHDGAQQRLTTIGLDLRHAQHLLGPQTHPSGPVLDRAVGELSAAIEDLRELARGVLPPSLDEGLAAAIGDLAARSPVPVTVLVARRERFDRPLETATYFVASEGLTNAIKHADATAVTISVERSAEHLTVRVADDGRGGADAGGSGLRGLADRVAAHGGRFVVDSPSGHGTTIVAELPCAS